MPDHGSVDTSRANIADALLLRGEPNEAIEIYARWNDRTRRDCGRDSAYARVRLGEAFRKAGRPEEAEVHDRAAIAEAERGGATGMVFHGLVGLAEDYIALDRADECIELLERALLMDISKSADRARAEVDLATALSRTGIDPKRARSRRPRARPHRAPRRAPWRPVRRSPRAGRAPHEDGRREQGRRVLSEELELKARTPGP